MCRTPLMPIALAAAIAAAMAAPTTVAMDAANASAPSRPQVEIENALASLGERGQLPLPGDPPLELSSPARERWELGAVLDLAAQGVGLPVLAVSPGGPAAAMGLAAGDRVLAINGTAQSGGPGAAGRLATALGAREGALALDIARNEQRLTLQGEASSVTVPGYSIRVEPSGAPGSTCGSVTLIQIDRPREQLFRVALIGINGRANFDAGRQIFELQPGRHSFGLDELIPSDRFSGGEHFDRQRARQRNRTDQELVIDVEAGVNYQLAARLLPREQRDIDSGRYWEPVIAKQRAQACRGSGITAQGR